MLTKSLDKEFKKERQRRRRGHAHERSGLSAAVVPYEFSRRVNCSSSGTATVTGTVTPRQIPRGADSSGIVVFENCNGVDGTTNFTGSSTYANNKYASEKHVDGGVTFVCSGVIPGSAALHLAFQTSVTSTGAGVTFSGDFSASCGAVPLVSCAWSKIALPDPAAVQAGCQK